MNFIKELSFSDIGFQVMLSHWWFGHEISFDSNRLNVEVKAQIAPLISSGVLEGRVKVMLSYQEFSMECGEVKEEGVGVFEFDWRAYKPWWVNDVNNDRWSETPFCGGVLLLQ